MKMRVYIRTPWIDLPNNIDAINVEDAISNKDSVYMYIVNLLSYVIIMILLLMEILNHCIWIIHNCLFIVATIKMILG